MESRGWLEERRRRAWELKNKGWLQSKIAEALGVTQGAVSMWLKRAREGGEEALRARKRGGSQPQLSAEQRARLLDLLLRGAQAFGFEGDVWTLPLAREGDEELAAAIVAMKTQEIGRGHAALQVFVKRLLHIAR
jgi:transposase